MSLPAFIRPRSVRPASGPLIINPLGDSIMNGPADGTAFRALLLAKIAARYGGAIGPAGVVDSKGGKDNLTYGYDPAIYGTSASGFNNTSAAYWFNNGTMAQYDPGTVHVGVFMLGANDAPTAETVTTYTGPVADQFFDLHPMALLLWGSRTPASGGSGDVYDAAVKAAVEARRAKGKNVVYVDMYRAVDLADSWDGLHFGAEGNRKMADAWFAALEPYL